MTPSLVWLYGVAGADGAAWGDETVGIEGRPVRAIREGDLVAIVSDVPLAAYEQPALDESTRAIVERHGGRIWLESEAGRGTSVHVALPVGNVRAAPAGAASQARAEVSAS